MKGAADAGIKAYVQGQADQTIALNALFAATNMVGANTLCENPEIVELLMETVRRALCNGHSAVMERALSVLSLASAGRSYSQWACAFTDIAVESVHALICPGAAWGNDVVSSSSSPSLAASTVLANAKQHACNMLLKTYIHKNDTALPAPLITLVNDPRTSQVCEAVVAIVRDHARGIPSTPCASYMAVTAAGRLLLQAVGDGAGKFAAVGSLLIKCGGLDAALALANAGVSHTKLCSDAVLASQAAAVLMKRLTDEELAHLLQKNPVLERCFVGGWKRYPNTSATWARCIKLREEEGRRRNEAEMLAKAEEAEKAAREAEAAAEAQRATSEAQRATSEAQRATSEAQRATSEAKVAAAEAEIATLKTQLAATEAKLAATKAELAATWRERNEAFFLRAATEAENGFFKSKVNTFLDERDEAVAERDEAMAKRDEAAAKLATSEAKLAATKAELAATKAKCSAMWSERNEFACLRESTAAENGFLKRQVNTFLDERDEAVAERDGAMAKRDEAVAKLAASEAERDEAVAKLATSEAERDEAVAKLATSEAERDEAVAKLAASDHTLCTLRAVCALLDAESTQTVESTA